VLFKELQMFMRDKLKILDKLRRLKWHKYLKDKISFYVKFGQTARKRNC